MSPFYYFITNVLFIKVLHPYCYEKYNESFMIIIPGFRMDLCTL